MGVSVTLYHVDTMATTVLCFALSLSNLTCKLWVMRGGILLMFGHGSKVKVNFGTLCILRPYGKDTDYSVCQVTFIFCWWWEEEPYWIWVIDSKVKVNFAPLPMRGDATLCVVYSSNIEVKIVAGVKWYPNLRNLLFMRICCRGI